MTVTASGYISVGEFKLLNPHLDYSIYPDTTLSGLIHAATRRVDVFLGYTLPIESVVGEKIRGGIDTRGNFEIWTRKYPVESVSSLKLSKGTSSLTLTLTDAAGANKYDIPANSAPPVSYPASEFASTSSSLLLFDINSADWFYTINYRAGYETIPQDVKDATSFYVKEAMAERYNPGGFSSLNQGSISFSARAKSVMSREAEDLLLRYKRVWS